MLKLDDLRKKNAKELQALDQELGEEQFKLKLQHKLGQLEKSHRLQEIRRDIARVKTVQSQTQG